MCGEEQGAGRGREEGEEEGMKTGRDEGEGWVRVGKCLGCCLRRV